MYAKFDARRRLFWVSANWHLHRVITALLAIIYTACLLLLISPSSAVSRDRIAQDDKRDDLSVFRSWAHRVGETFKDCPRCPEMVVVPAGGFYMGSPADERWRQSNEGPQHRVLIETPFAVGRFEVTFAEWLACVSYRGCGGYRPDDKGWGRGDHPVINVSWDNANAYVSWLRRRTGKPYRLLSEAEWEYVARAGTTTAYFTGSPPAEHQANYGKNATSSVGSYPPNAFNVYDMIGNVSEIVADCWNDGYAGLPAQGIQGAPIDGSAWLDGDCSQRVARGWSIGSGHGSVVRTAWRSPITGEGHHPTLGFRVALSLEATPGVANPVNDSEYFKNLVNELTIAHNNYDIEMLLHISATPFFMGRGVILQNEYELRSTFEEALFDNPTLLPEGGFDVLAALCVLEYEREYAPVKETMEQIGFPLLDNDYVVLVQDHASGGGGGFLFRKFINGWKYVGTGG